jgi:hypothetical protein
LPLLESVNVFLKIFPYFLQALEFVRIFITHVMSMVSLAFRIVISNYPVSAGNVYERIFKSMRPILTLWNLPYFDTFDGAKPRFLNRGKKRRSVSTLSIPRASDRGVEWVDFLNRIVCMVFFHMIDEPGPHIGYIIPYIKDSQVHEIFESKIVLKLAALCKIMRRGLDNGGFSKDERCICSDSWSFLSASEGKSMDGSY